MGSRVCSFHRLHRATKNAQRHAGRCLCRIGCRRAALQHAEEKRLIITRSPLRISLGGGGTDLPSYYRQHEGFLIAATIDKYVYITLNQTFVPDLAVRYSQLERVTTVDQLQHPITREAFVLLDADS